MFAFKASKSEALNNHNYQMKSNQLLKRTSYIAILIIFLISTVSPGPVLALTKTETNELKALEKRFFEHTYPKENTENRLERVEKLVFGEAKSGDDSERLVALSKVLPKNPEPAQTKSKKEKGPGKMERNSPVDTTVADPSTDYPRVDAIEQVMLGKAFKNEALGKRLDQLELKAFKKSTSDPDLSKRVEKLEKYVRKHYHKKVSNIVDPRNSYGSAGNTAYNPPSYSSGGSGSYGMAPPTSSYNRGSSRFSQRQEPVSLRLSYLENKVFGHSYPNKPLIERVNSLENNVFPNDPPDKNTSIPQQISLIEHAVGLMHKPEGSKPETASQFPSWPPKSNSPSYGGYASQNQVGGNLNQSQGNSSIYGGANSQAFGGANTQAYNANPYQQTQQYQQPQQQKKKKRGHPLLKSLARSLLTVGAVAAGSALGGGYYGGGYGRGYGGGYGRGYGYGNSMYRGGYGMGNAYRGY